MKMLNVLYTVDLLRGKKVNDTVFMQNMAKYEKGIKCRRIIHSADMLSRDRMTIDGFWNDDRIYWTL
jgi:hypothetical protein